MWKINAFNSITCLNSFWFLNIIYENINNTLTFLDLDSYSLQVYKTYHIIKTYTPSLKQNLSRETIHNSKPKLKWQRNHYFNMLAIY